MKGNQVWQRELVEKALGVGLGFVVDLNVWEVNFKVEIGLEIELKIGKNYFQIELKIQKIWWK